jgi:release factor glutamine methyltransferase
MTVAAETTVKMALAAATAQLSAVGISQARREARLLVAAALDWDAARVIAFPDAELPAEVSRRLQDMIARRSAREPVSRILGHREFWSLRFDLSPDTLDPRPDSETLIEATLAVLDDRERAYRVLDFGTGSGCLLLSLLSELPNAVGTGVDLLEGALDTARRNAAALGLAGRARFVCANWGEGLSGDSDVILANPPYIASVELGRLMPEIACYEPRLALDGGADGLLAYRELAPEIARLLAPGGIAVVEVGAGRAADVTAILAEAGLALRVVRHDLSGVDRCIVLGLD